MAKKTEEVRTAPRTARANEYRLNRRDMASPYYQSFYASRNERPAGKSVKMRPIYVGAPQGEAYDDYDEYYEEPKGKKAKHKRTKGKAKRARRGFMVFLVALFTLLYIAVPVVGYLNLDALSDFNGYFALLEVPGGDPEADTVAEEETAEASAESGSADENSGEENAADAESDVPATEYIGAADIVTAFIALFADGTDVSDNFIYNEYFAGIDGADTVTMIAAYALPVTLAIGLIVALIFFIRAVITLCGSKKRKLFIFSSILMLLMTILFAACGFLLVAGTDFGVLMAFISMDGSLAMQLGFGTIIMAALSLLTLIASMFAFRRQKKLY